MISPAADGCYYPVLSGDTKNYPISKVSAGSTVIDGILTTNNFKIGQGIIIRGGLANIQLDLGSLGSWQNISRDLNIHTKGLFSYRFDVDQSYIMGDEIGHFDFDQPQDWSKYDEIRFDLKCVGIYNFGRIVPGGLVIVLRNSAGKIISRLGADLNISTSNSFLRVLVPIIGSNDVKSLSICIDNLKDASDKFHNNNILDQSGPIFNTGVGFTLWIDNICLTADLHTSVIVVLSSTSLELFDPLGADLPDTTLGSTPMLYHDDASVLQSFIDQVPDFSEIVFSTKIPCGSSIILQGRQGLKFVGRGGLGFNKNFGVPSFHWLGKAGQDFFIINRSRDLVFDSLAWFCNYALPPISAVNLDEFVIGSGITSHCKFRNCYVQGPLGYDDFCGFSISRVSRENCEFITFDDVWVDSGKGEGFYIGGSFNAKNIIFNRCSTNNSSIGWRCDRGSCHLIDCHANYNGIDVVQYNSAEPIIIEGFNSEYAKSALYLNNTHGAIVSGCRWDALLGNSAIKLGAFGGCYQFLNNKIIPASVVKNGVLIDPASISGEIISRGNVYGYPINNSNLWITGGGAISEGDQFLGRSFVSEILCKRHIQIMDDNHIVHQLIGKGSSGRKSGFQVAIGDGGVITNSWLQVGGGLHLKRTIVKSDIDFTVGNTIKDQTPGIILVDATDRSISILITNPTDYKEIFGQLTSPIWEFRRIDTGTNIVRIAPYSRGLQVEGMDQNGWIYIVPGQSFRLISDGNKYWRL